jgi:hypothetical protein
MLKTWFEAVPRFFKELKRRKVIRLRLVYAIVAGVVAEVGSNTFAALHLPDWALTLVIVLLILGFPIAIVLAWALEITPTGIRAEQELPAPSAPAARTALSFPGADWPFRTRSAARRQARDRFRRACSGRCTRRIPAAPGARSLPACDTICARP